MKYNFDELIVVKVGTNILTTTENGTEKIDVGAYERIGNQLRELSDEGKSIILISSGAITAGVVSEGLCRADICDIATEQRYAARGWDIVVQQWKRSIGETRVSSTLLTKREISTPNMRQKLLQAIGCCLSYKDIFVVNENDCLSDDEIKFGDNDTLAAAITTACKESGMFKSIRLVLLTNKNGLNKVADDDNTLIRTVDDISKVERYAGNANNNHSRGGMKSKIKAAKIATSFGVETYIAHGSEDLAIKRALNKSIGTFFAV